MNSSPFLLPPEIMVSLTDEWLDRCQSNPSSYNLGSSLDWSKPRCDASHLRGPEQQHLDHLATWHFSSRSSMNVQRSFHEIREQSCADVPDLSHTPFSCDSNVSGSASLSFDSLSDDDFAYYAPDLDALSSRAFDLSGSSFLTPDFSHPSFPCLDSTDNESIIHSPKPTFGYNTFEFEFDRPHSCDPAVALTCEENIAMSHHKRHREDDENGFENIAFPKRRKLSDEAPGLFSLFPDPYRDIPSGWNSFSPLDTSYPHHDVFSMEQLLNCTNDWADDTWPPKHPTC